MVGGVGLQILKGKTPLGRNWCRWEENITFDLEEIKRKLGYRNEQMAHSCEHVMENQVLHKAGFFLSI